MADSLFPDRAIRRTQPPPSSQRTPPVGSSATTLNDTNALQSLLDSANAEAATRPGAGTSVNEPYHLHVYAHKHNTHVTFTDPSRSSILSTSCGNIGLRKAQRGSFEAAYNLATYTMRKMAQIQWRLGGKKMTMNPLRTLKDVGNRDSGGVGIEVVMRGYGPGREAFQKALLGQEGQMVKPFVVRVTDGTRLKFGGARSPAVRRLG